MSPGCSMCGQRDSLRGNRTAAFGRCGGCGHRKPVPFIASCACEDADTEICTTCAGVVARLAEVDS